MAETKEQHRERGRRTYAYLKEQHRCIKCQKQDAYTLAGRARCFECEEKHKEAVQRCNTPEKRAEREKRTRDNRRNSGACTACGKMMPVGDDHMTCQSCRARNRIKLERYRRRRGAVSLQERSSGDMCFNCLSPDVIPGKKVCKSCAERLSTHLDNIRPDNKNHIWRLLEKAHLAKEKVSEDG